MHLSNEYRGDGGGGRGSGYGRVQARGGDLTRKDPSQIPQGVGNILFKL